MTGLGEDLRRSGFRATAQRKAVLACLADRPHATVAELLTDLGGQVVSRPGLYNVLNDFARAGLIRSIAPAGSPARYELRTGDNHHHVVCRTCRRIQDVDCVTGQAPCLEPAGTAGFAVDEAEVTFWGLCDACRAA